MVRAMLTRFCSESSRVIIFETFGLPAVSVPVLSNAMVFTVLATSKDVPPLIKTPFLAALPMAETMATGVEITKAQGHAITSNSRLL